MDDTNTNPSDPQTDDVNAANSDLMSAQAAEATSTPTDEASENPFAALKENNSEAEKAIQKDSETGNPEDQKAGESETVSSDTSDQSDTSDSPSPSESSEKEEAKESEDTEAVEEPKEEEKPAVPANPNARWYVVHTFAGHENKVATALRQRIEAERLEHLIYDILVPTQDKIEIKGGRKETVKEKIFPGYILIKMELSDLSWLAVRTTQGVTSFIGAGNKPTPISEAEVATIVKFTTQGASPTFKDVFMVDDTVKIIDGPFAEFIGKVDSVDKEKGRVRVLVSIFGRETPVELDFLQVQKL
jgi:transcription termination/antitermination protein NusG